MRLTTRPSGPALGTLGASQSWLERVSRLVHQLFVVFRLVLENLSSLEVCWIASSRYDSTCGQREVASDLLETDSRGSVVGGCVLASAGITARLLLRFRVARQDLCNVDANLNSSTILSLLSDSVLVGGWE